MKLSKETRRGITGLLILFFASIVYVFGGFMENMSLGFGAWLGVIMILVTTGVNIFTEEAEG